MSTENPIDILFFHWQQTLKMFGVNPVTASQLFNDLVAAYSLPHRHYHTLQHIHHVLTTIDTLQPYTQDISSVHLAAWFHDVVYDTQAEDNEEKSANFAGEVLKKLGISNQKITTISHLILHTKHHIADDLDSRVLLDADLAILAVNPVEYQEYAKAIRQEYAWVPKAEYINGRRQVLQRFLERQRIYFTPLMFEVAEQSARSNIRAEIQMLDNFTG